MTDEVSQKPSPPNWANKVSALVAAGVALVAVAGFAVRGEMRIAALEKQIDALVVTQASGPGTNATVAKSEACDDLARRVATAYEIGTNLTVGQPLEDLMARMGCSAPRR